MTVVEKNQGTKIDYELNGNLLALNNELSLNLEAYQRDFDVSLDVSRNNQGMLVMGLSERYVVQLEIPARQYDVVDVVGEDEEVTESFVPQPFDVDAVTLILWGVE